MVKTGFIILTILHGLVHLLYLGQSQRFFELQPDMVWPDESWVFSRFLKVEIIRLLASAFCALAAFTFVASGAGNLFDQDWRHAAVVIAAIVSTLGYILFWDGTRRKLHDQGGIGLLINIGILIAQSYI